MGTEVVGIPILNELELTGWQGGTTSSAHIQPRGETEPNLLYLLSRRQAENVSPVDWPFPFEWPLAWDGNHGE